MSRASARRSTRVDGRAKVTGAARYTAEIALPGMAYAGDRRRDDRQRAGDARSTPRPRARADGVLAVLTHENLPKIAARAAPAAVAGRRRRARARASSRCRTTSCTTPASLSRSWSPTRSSRPQHAASLVRVSLRARRRRSPRSTQGRDQAYEAGAALRRADARRATSAATSRPALAAADVRVEAAYRLAANHHNPIEAPATIAVWDGDRLTLVRLDDGHPRHPADRRRTCSACRSPNVRVHHRSSSAAASACKAMVWPHVTLDRDGRPRTSAGRCKLMLTRPQMFTSNGHREEQEQRITLGADAGRPADRDPARQALDHLAVRRLGRAGDRRLARSCTPARTTTACTG